MKKRLIRQAATPQEQSLINISNDGKKILQLLENMKFKIDQSARLFGNNPEVSKKIMQNSDIISQLQSGLYNVSYNLENIDLIPSYNESQVQLTEGTPSDAEQNPAVQETEEESEEQEQEQPNESEPESNEEEPEEKSEEEPKEETKEDEEE